MTTPEASTHASRPQPEHHLIIGGSTGIGAEVRRMLEGAGHRTTCLGRNSTPPFDVQADASGLPDMETALHGLVYCPGSITLRPFQRLSIEDFVSDLEINFLGAVRVLQRYLEPLRRSERGSVVFFSTVAVQNGMPFHASIAAAKGAVEAFARAVAAEFAPTLRVNVVAPSLTETPLAERLLRSERQREAAAQRHPMRRLGRPRDIAELTVFLLSERSSWMTGQVIGVDGGLSTLRAL